MNPHRKINIDITLHLNEHCTQQSIDESIALIYQCYIVECQRKGLKFAEPLVDNFGQQHIPHQFKQALHKYLWVNNLYLSHLSDIQNTFYKIMNNGN